MAVAHRAHGLEIAGRRRRGAERRAHHRFGHEGGHRLRPQPLELGLQLIRQPLDEGRLGLPGSLMPVGESRRDMAERVAEQRRVGRPPGHVAARRQNAQRISVIALPARDEAAALRLPDLDEILPRQLQRGFPGFGPAGHDEGMGEPARRMPHQQFGQFLGRGGGEKTAIGEGQLSRLPLDGRDDARVAVAETGNRRTA